MIILFDQIGNWIESENILLIILINGMGRDVAIIRRDVACNVPTTSHKPIGILHATSVQHATSLR